MPIAAKWSLTFAVLLIGLALMAYLLRVDLATKQHFLPQCLLKSFTGLYCPGCGNTRATQALLRGDVVAALHQNVMFVLALPFLVYGALRMWVNWVFPGTWKPIPFLKNFRWRHSYSITLVILIVAFSVLRNVPVKPFSWLAPVSLAAEVAEEN